MVSPWPGNHTANHTSAYVPADLPAYRAYVTAVVERYDWDGLGLNLREQVAALAVKGAEQILQREVNASVHAELLGRLKTEL